MFCHLHVHTTNSLLDGLGTSDQYAKKAAELGFSHLAITDHGNVDGIIKFQKACEKYGISPVIGCELYIVGDVEDKQRKSGHITVLVRNEKGMTNLFKLITFANLHGFYYKPRIDFKNLLSHCEGLVVLTGCANSFLHLEGGIDFFSKLVKTIPDDVFLEIMPHMLEDQVKHNQLCFDLSNKFNIPLVATNDCHYIEKEDSETHEVLLAIQTKAKMNQEDRFKFETSGFHLRTKEEMMAAFLTQGSIQRSRLRSALDMAGKIAQKCCGYRVPKHEIGLPIVPGYEAVNPDVFILRLCQEKLSVLGLSNNQEYLARLKEEHSLIVKKKFSPYFMIVWELINWCKKNGIATGPGRGSVGGSLVAYLMGITSIDPIQFNLIFARFIAESREDYPDIDCDIEDTKRHLVRRHLEDLYGTNNVTSISTFLSLKGRMAIRDVARVYDVPYKDVDDFAKAIGNDEVDNSVEYYAQNTPEGRYFASKYPHVVKHASKLEGQTRGTGKHAAGVILSLSNLSDGTKCNLSMRSKEIVCNWDMSDVEHVGLIKLDVLGLNMMTILNHARRLVKTNKDKEIDFDSIPLNDPKIFYEISKGNTAGAFQIGTRAMTDLVKEMGIENFNTLSDAVALVRPGPHDSGMTEEYIRRKRGKKWKKKNRLYEEITKDTQGIICYQEQVMEIIHKVAGLPYSTADKIRKIIGKKRDVREFAPFKRAFVQGCLKQKTLSEDEALDFWEALQAHAHYSFNKAHSVGYAILAYWTIWTKYYYPTEFMCASLTYGSSDADKKNSLVEEAYRLGLQVSIPIVGISKAEEWVANHKVLYAPYSEVKGIGPVFAKKCETLGKTSGFFKIEDPKMPKYQKLLHEIGCFGETPAKDISEYFSFKLRPISSFKEFSELPGDLSRFSFSELRTLNIPTRSFSRLIEEVSFCGHRDLSSCNKCGLRKQCRAPVHPSKGKFNVMIVGEAPGAEEDAKGEGFVGRSGKLLWATLVRHKLTREMFYVSNSVKCFPKDTRTPTKDEIQTCRCWLDKEITKIKPRLILAFGNTGLQTFAGEDSGIMNKNGTIEWNEKAKSWVCYCIHPSAVLRNPRNQMLFEKGIKVFADKLSFLPRRNNNSNLNK